MFYLERGIASGVDEIAELFGDVSSTVRRVSHDYEYVNYVVNGDAVVVEGRVPARRPTASSGDPTDA